MASELQGELRVSNPVVPGSIGSGDRSLDEISRRKGGIPPEPRNSSVKPTESLRVQCLSIQRFPGLQFVDPSALANCVLPSTPCRTFVGFWGGLGVARSRPHKYRKPAVAAFIVVK